MTRADKKVYIEDLESQAEEAAHRGEQGQVHKITKLVSSRYRRATDTPIVDRQERLLTTEAEKEARWVEHFSEVLNRPPPTTEAEVQYPDTDLDVSTAPPEKEIILDTKKDGLLSRLTCRPRGCKQISWRLVAVTAM